MKSRCRVLSWVVPWSLVCIGLPPSAVAAERVNRLISLLEAGEPAIGIHVGARAPNMARVLGRSGLDFIAVDMEHGIYDYQEVHQYILEVQDSIRYPWVEPGKPLPSILVKVGHRATWDPRYDIAESFKVGPVLGVFVPFVESRADLERAVSAARNPEILELAGVSPEERNDRLDVWPLNPKGELLVVAMIESEAGIRNAREIIETPGLGVLYIAHAPEADHERIRQMCFDRNVIVGRDEPDPARVKHWIDAGYRMITIAWDYRIFLRALTESLQTIRSSLK